MPHGFRPFFIQLKINEPFKSRVKVLACVVIRVFGTVGKLARKHRDIPNSYHFTLQHTKSVFQTGQCISKGTDTSVEVRPEDSIEVQMRPTHPQVQTAEEDRESGKTTSQENMHLDSCRTFCTWTDESGCSIGTRRRYSGSTTSCTSRRSKLPLLVVVVCSMLRLGACVPMGAMDLKDVDTVPPVHYASKNLDLTNPQAIVDARDTDMEQDEEDEKEKDRFEELSHHNRPPPHPRTFLPDSGRIESLEQDGNGQNPGEAEGARDGDSKNRTSVSTVAFNTLLMAVASGLGAAPFFMVQSVNRKWLGIANALASGVMLAASFGLIQEGLEGVKDAHEMTQLVRLVGGLLLGLVFIIASQRFVEDHEISMGSLRGMDARKAAMVMGIMTLHSFSEGLGVGVSYGGPHGHTQGAVTTWAIALHNIPEGLAVALVAVPRGESKYTAALWAVISSLPQPLVAVPAYLFVDAFTYLLPIGLGCAAGTMIWMVFAELIPDALKTTDAHTIATVLTLALIFQVAAQTLIQNAV